MLNGKQCRVQKYNKSQERDRCNVFVRGLHKSIDNERLEQLFSRFGIVVSSKVQRNPKTNESLGYGYVSFQHETSAKLAVEKVNYQYPFHSDRIRKLYFYIHTYIHMYRQRARSKQNHFVVKKSE